MRRLILSAAALAFLFGVPPAARAEDPAVLASKTLNWQKDFDAAKAQAAKEKKGLFVYLTPDWFP